MTAARYSAYKPSGVEWLGDVPAHWRIDRLKASIALCRNGIWGDEPKGDENDIPCVRVADFDRQGLLVKLEEPTIRNVTEKERTGRLLSKGELLLEKSGGGENQPVGCVVLYDDARPAVCSNFVARVVPAPGQSSSYWRYVHAAAYAVRLTVGSINQTSGIQNLDQARYFNEYAAFPPPEEQLAITAYLDRETAKIDALVDEQKRLIELLKEKRQVVISQAVTKGLDPNVPMKDSGVAWLGEVPAHWAIAPIGARYSVQLGKMLDTAKITGANLRPYLRVFDVQWGRINIDDLPMMDFDADERNKFRLVTGDLLVNEGGSYPGRAAIWSADIEECYYQKALHRLRVLDAKRDTPPFLFYLMVWATGHGVFSAGGNEATIEHLPAERLRRYRFPFPPIHEQISIAAYVADQSQALESLMSESLTAVQLLQERRAALISAAVTGKIDVRNSAVNRDQANVH